jgi:sarcosine oxidase
MPVDLDRRADVAVVGAGIMGAAVAWRLAQRGLSVVLFEQFKLLHTRGSSHGASRIFRLAYEQVDYVLLAQDALPLWREAEKALAQELLMTTGAVDFGPDFHLEPLARALAAAGESLERLRNSEMRARFPWIRVPEGWGAIFHERGGVLLADACRQGLTELARGQGAVICDETAVTALRVAAAGVEIETGLEEWTVSKAVIASASWSDRLLAPLDLSVPLTITREHVGYYAERVPSDVIPFIWHAGSASPEIYGLPNGRTGLVKIAHHGSGPVTDPDSEVSADIRLLAPVNEFVRQTLDSLDPHPSMVETCLYATSPDDDFVIDRVGSLVLCMGFGGHGFKFAPAIGELAANLVTDVSAVVPERFAHSRFAKRGAAQT